MHEIEDKDISIIVTDFNRLQYINYALSSIPIHGIETILVTNMNENRIYNDKVKYIFDEGKTYGNMLKVAIQESKGDIICFLEDDDVFSPDKIKYIKKIFSSNPDLSYYHNSHFKIDGAGRRFDNERKKECLLFKPFESYHEVKRVMNRDVDHNLSSVTIKKQYVSSDELATLSKINLSVDTYMFAISLKDGTVLIDDNRLLTGYRIHSSTSNPIAKTSITNPYIRLHKLYSLDYKISSCITKNIYFKDFLICRYKIEKLYYSKYLKENILKNVIDSVPCIKYLDTTTIRNRINMSIGEFHK